MSPSALPTSSPTSNVTTEDVVIHGAEALFTPQKFPIPGVQLCFMSGDGAQVDVPMKVGQDSRSDKGLGSAAATTTVLPVAGQNGCFDIPWIVNGGYTATIARSGASATYGFCAGVGAGNNAPSVRADGVGIGKCAQVAFNRRPDGNPYPSGTVLNGSIVTGADNHAVQVCVSAFSPGPAGTAGAASWRTRRTPTTRAGAVNLTPLTLEFPSQTAIKVETFDITGPGPGGQGGAQFGCQATIRDAERLGDHGDRHDAIRRGDDHRRQVLLHPLSVSCKGAMAPRRCSYRSVGGARLDAPRPTIWRAEARCHGTSAVISRRLRYGTAHRSPALPAPRPRRRTAPRPRRLARPRSPPRPRR